MLEQSLRRFSLYWLRRAKSSQFRAPLVQWYGNSKSQSLYQCRQTVCISTSAYLGGGGDGNREAAETKTVFEILTSAERPLCERRGWGMKAAPFGSIVYIFVCLLLHVIKSILGVSQQRGFILHSQASTASPLTRT
jgi:hypothetical protein